MKTIRDLRRVRGWTQFELALEVEVQPQANSLESDRRTPKVPPLRRLGVVFARCGEPGPGPPLDSPGRLGTRRTRRR